MITLVLDMDQTFYNPHAPFKRVMAELQRYGFAPGRIEATLAEANNRGYSFELHLRLLGVDPTPASVFARRWANYYADGARFLLPGVERGVHDLHVRHRLRLVTFGDTIFQRRKFDNLPEAFQLRFVATHYVLELKGPTLARIADEVGPDEEVVFADDSASHLLSVRKHAPRVRCVRMMWPQFNLQPHPGDGVEWQVATNFDELVNLLPAP